MSRYEYEDCPKCGYKFAGLLNNFFHDRRCWGRETALYNAKWVMRNRLKENPV